MFDTVREFLYGLEADLKDGLKSIFNWSSTAADIPAYSHLRGPLARIPEGNVAVDVMAWKLVGGLAEHRFLRFTFNSGDGPPDVLDFHGLATDRDIGVSRPIGYAARDNIVISTRFPTKESDAENATVHLRREGIFNAADAKRMMAALAIGGREINNLKIPYKALQADPFLVDAHWNRIEATTNSNAASRTLMELAGLNPDNVHGGWAPGFSGRLLPLKSGHGQAYSIQGIRSTLSKIPDDILSQNLGRAMDALLMSVPGPKNIEALNNSRFGEVFQKAGFDNYIQDRMEKLLERLNAMTVPAPVAHKEKALLSP